MITQVLGPTFRYSHTIGRADFAGPSFINPVGMVRGADDRIYVVNRGYGWRADGIRITICTVGEEYLGEFGKSALIVGEEAAKDAPLVWPASIALDRQGQVYVVDEWVSRISIFTPKGDLISYWGTRGEGDGEFNRPSGIVFDADDNIYLADAGNNRIQKFTRDGKFLLKWGRAGTGDGEFNLPWGIDIDQRGDVYVVDWRNDRIQKFTSDGQFLMRFGRSGSADGQFNRPTSVAVDKEGTIYVTDWGNERVQIFDRGGAFIAKLTGDATVSKWAKEKLDSNPDMWRAREVAHFLEREKLFQGPIAVEVDDQGRIFVVDCARSRIQVYKKIVPYFLGKYDNGRL